VKRKKRKIKVSIAHVCNHPDSKEILSTEAFGENVYVSKLSCGHKVKWWLKFPGREGPIRMPCPECGWQRGKSSWKI